MEGDDSDEIEIISYESGPTRGPESAQKLGAPKRNNRNNRYRRGTLQGWRKKGEGIPCTTPGCNFRGWAEPYRRHQLNKHKIHWLARNDPRLKFRKRTSDQGPGPDYTLRDTAEDGIAAAMDDAGVGEPEGALTNMERKDEADGLDVELAELLEPGRVQRELEGEEKSEGGEQEVLGRTGEGPDGSERRDGAVVEQTVEKIIFNEDVSNFLRNAQRNLGEDLPEVAMMLEVDDGTERRKCYLAAKSSPGTAELPIGGGRTRCLVCFETTSWSDDPGSYRSARDRLRKHVNTHSELWNAMREGREILEGFLETARRVNDDVNTISNPPTANESIVFDSGKRQHERYMREVLPEHARISNPDQHQLTQRVQVELHRIPIPELEYQRELQAQAGPSNLEATNDQSNPNKKRKSPPTDGRGTPRRRSAPHRAPGAPRRTPEAISGWSVSMSWQERICRSVTAVAGNSEDTSEGTASNNSAQRAEGVERDERAVRAERAERTLATLSTLKRKTSASTKKGKK